MYTDELPWNGTSTGELNPVRTTCKKGEDLASACLSHASSPLGCKLASSLGQQDINHKVIPLPCVYIWTKVIVNLYQIIIHAVIKHKLL